MSTTSSISVTVTAGPCLIGDIAEQLAWLAATLRSPPSSMSRQGVVTCVPSIQNIRKPSDELFWACDISFDMEQILPSNSHDGSCWTNLFWNPILVRGYPIRARSELDTGLEMSLEVMSLLMRASQIVLWDRRILIKGFSALVVATEITAEVPELDSIATELPDNISLRALEGRRHMVGWCPKAVDWCGQPGINLDIGASGLRRPPASIVVDRLYPEGGSNIIGGLNMALNKKEKPFWLERERDYPSLLKWISLQPIVFYDVATQRAWLIDGASALLHLVRISLYNEEQDPESTYEWVFEPSKFKDKWDNATGRLAALKTLKSWDNLNLNLYVASKQVRVGKTITEYSTLETKVKKILHSIKILIDRQIKVASSDGIAISQSLDLHKTIPGFDILDIIFPLGPIHPRVKQLDFVTPGWQDLIPAIGITTIFGCDFGELIRPDDPSAICRRWSTVPTGSDFLAASMSTLKMLHERRLMRMWPDLAVGELTAKIMWLSSPASLQACHCVRTSQIGSPRDWHSSPIQFIVSKKSWTARLRSRNLTPVEFSRLDAGGAVIFGQLPLPFSARDEKEARETSSVQERDDRSTAGLEFSSAQESIGTLSPSISGSATGSFSTQPTTVTASSSGSCGEVGDGSNSEAASSISATKRSKKTSFFKRIRDIL
ncbi:hypothetical protein HJFPF1_05468 [Paramyrothecium foliicola]|nr:hypothetical protein HJFPF1_05468 [Paramyrothecium foliicola]